MRLSFQQLRWLGFIWFASLCVLFLVNISCEVVICVYVVGFAADRPVKLNLEVALFIPTKYSRVLVFASKDLTMVILT